MPAFNTLKKRKDFLRVAKGVKVVTTTMILQAALSLSKDSLSPKFGFTTTKRLGKAVVRNRARRRLRASVVENIQFCKNNIEYVLIGRYNTADCQFSELVKDTKYAFQKATKLLLNQDTKNNE